MGCDRFAIEHELNRLKNASFYWQPLLLQTRLDTLRNTSFLYGMRDYEYS